MTLFPKGRLSRRKFLAGTGAVAAGISVLPRDGWSAEEAKLNFYNWDTYIGETTLDDFKTASGVSVKMDLFADNAELFAKLKEGNPGYDVIVPTNDYIERMIAAKMLMPLDHSKIPNKVNLQSAFLDAGFDPGRKFSMPYMWGTMGIGYRKSKVDGVPDSWKWLFDSDRYKGRCAVLSEAVGVLGAVFKYMGEPLNTTDPKLIKAAEAMLIKQKPNLKLFAPDNGQDLLLSGEVDLTMEWNGDILQVMAEDDDLSYVVPKEGSIVWQDTLTIPNGAPHPENAHNFINFVLEAQAGAGIADAIQYATPNAAARVLMPESYSKNPAIFPSDETLAACEAAIYLGPEVSKLYDEAWTRIQAA
jgi:spermidine/putrescine transport system substrate-binding protein